jgi:hypothetical protein
MIGKTERHDSDAPQRFATDITIAIFTPRGNQ